MNKAWVLMTAMPPTKGHANLIKFAASLDVEEVNVILCTQPGEPYVSQRVMALKDIATNVSVDTAVDVKIHHWFQTMPQDPEIPGFWSLWKTIAQDHGALPGDYWVTSEGYGKKMAEITDGIFVPYDLERILKYTKGTNVRENFIDNFDQIAFEFQRFVTTKVTIFGAESTGKTTLAKRLAEGNVAKGNFFFEYARPYLEEVGTEISVKSMTAIWKGQAALQLHANDFYDRPYHVFDTDLYSTIGYWEQPHWAETLGDVPKGLITDAGLLKSDLYIILKSNIPFEADPLRYGGDKRESSDEYWISVAEKYNLNYVVIDESDLETRHMIAALHTFGQMRGIEKELEYDRGGH